MGKGLAAASLASLIERRGLSIGMLKMDPYINVDPGTMSPTQHGEVFVTDDGAETDLDLGHYERFTNLTLLKQNNFTTGQVYLQVIENEREGKYLGKTVQVVPHITDEIKKRIKKAGENCDVLIGEIGGTVGDIESLPFLESIRQFAQDEGVENVLFIHLVLVPFLGAAGELKSKPAQHSVKELRSIGLFPQMVILRADRPVDADIVDKISLFCNVSRKNVFQSVDLDSIYKLPLNFHQQGLDAKVIEELGIWAKEPELTDLNRVITNMESPKGTITIGLVGKYTELTESYKSLGEALTHASIAEQVNLETHYIDSSEIEKGDYSALDKVDGILVPGGFGERGTEGKIAAIKYAREKKKPFFGICLGMQLAMIEFARHEAGIADATSAEFSETGSQVVHYMTGQTKEMKKGGSMRLGAYECDLLRESLALRLYQSDSISERHRHRLEVNNEFVPKLEEAGMVISGKNKKLDLVEIIELKDHPFFIACQFHPEFKSRPTAAHPLFLGFVRAAKKDK